MEGDQGQSSLANENMLEKSIKDHPIVVGAYAQWFVSKSGRKESMYSQIMDTKLKDKVDKISS